MALLILGLVVLSDALSDALRRHWLAPTTLRRETSSPALEPGPAAELGGIA